MSVDIETLLDFVRGNLDEASDAAVRAALAHDATMAGTVGLLRLLVERASSFGEAPPPGLRERLLALYDGHAEKASEADLLDVDPLAIELAAFFDSYRDEVLGATRGPGASTRRLAYTCAAADIVLDIAPGQEGRVDLVGQVFRREGPTAPASGLPSLAHVAGSTEVEIDATGRFYLNGLPTDVGPIRLDLGDQRLVLTVTAKLDRG